TWYNSFFQILHENCQADDLDERFGRVAVVSFNYDRCIEHYLHCALRNYYDVTTERATEVMRNMQIFHPYGSVGALPWRIHNGGVVYGANVGADTLISSSKGIRTFTEGIDPSNSDIEYIRAILRDADRIAFLGFAFH